MSVFVVLFFAVAALGAAPAALTNYSADMETTSPQGSSISKIFFKDGKMRMEREQGRKTINITRPDKKVIWMLMADSKTYMEIALDLSTQDIQAMLRDPNIRTDKEFVGNETVDRHPTKKYRLTITTDGKKEKSGYIWEATDLSNFVVKYQSEDKKITSIWKNIKTGVVSDSMFELPAGYTRMDIPAMPNTGGGAKQQKR